MLTVGLGIVRAKAMALLLGPAGFGLMGIYASIADMVRSVAEMGINGSGVRQIAAAIASGDEERIARTVTVLRRVTLLLGICGAVTLVLLARQISQFTFGNELHAGAIGLLSFAVLFRLVADGQMALIQGMRRIGDLAKVSICGALAGTVIGIGLVYLMGEDGVVPSLIGVAAMSIATSAWYSRKINVVPAILTRPQFQVEATSLLRLGFSFMVSAFLVAGAGYAVRLIVVSEIGLDAAGLYQAAWTLGGLYIGFVLQAMGADFYPRLVGSVSDHAECNRLVNEQAHISLLLAGPGVLATLTLSSFVVVLFYSSAFDGAVETLRWISAGMMLRVISWPMGFIIVAKGAQRLFLLTEVAWASAYVLLAWQCVVLLGLRGVGVAFLASYVLHCLMVYPLVRRMTGFRWDWATIRPMVFFLASVAATLLAFLALPPVHATLFGLVSTLISSAYSFRQLLKLGAPQHVPKPVMRLLSLLHLTSATDRVSP